MTVDVERLVSGWLRAQPEVTELVAGRVYTELPARAEYPLLRLTQIGGQPLYSRPLWIDESLLQFDAYGGPKAMARQLMDTVRGLLDAGIVGTHDAGVITDVQWGLARYLPDDSFDPSQPRWVFEGTFISHP